tara:strand:- start:459 stop:788 length:330 start_codon:yes stop_codon:yes gene_type:complete
MNNNELFITLVSSLTSQAWIQLGKMKNPVSDKIEKNLEAASMSIDMLTMIQDKTKNNLDEYESKLLEQSLNDLRMNFVFEKNQGSDNEEKSESDKKKKTAKKKNSKKKK